MSIYLVLAILQKYCVFDTLVDRTKLKKHTKLLQAYCAFYTLL
ncbi:hypothetical protein SAMN05444401_2179 [Clostridium amylolyticum]|uniref:Uncharacterized protein n=1 Tax=Clostridium amylolyticum TaxID=1121298 RepID=A0A1M6GNI2_9CLOT|nr:hypothetical protein SAMN05444401_2179 [Clostridium amylolyticum]